MIHDFSSSLDDHILSALFKASILTRGQSVQLQRYPLNFDRKDTRRRAGFRVWVGGKIAFHLTAGASLKSLHRLADGFAKANPEIACKPLFFVKEQGLELFGQEYFGVGNLEEGIANRKIDENTWRNAVVFVKTKLAASAKPSSYIRLMQELNTLEKRILSLEWFSHFDQAFISEAIFPLIRHGATQLPARTQWSNGDFIAKNILFDSNGDYRLIDAEFGSETHFAEIDWFRLKRFSNVPAGVDVTALAGLRPQPVWLELLSWLQHALRLSEVCMPGVVGPNLKIVSENIATLLAKESSFAQRSLFVGALDQNHRLGGKTPSEAQGVNLTLEWSRTGSMAQLQKASQQLESQTWNELNFTLNQSDGRTLLARFQLPDSPATFDLRSMELRTAASGALVWSAAGSDLAKIVVLEGNAIQIPADEGLRVVHFGNRTDLTLPVLDLGQLHDALKLTVWLHYTPSVEEFSQRLRDALNNGQTALAFGGPFLSGTAIKAPAIAPTPPTAQLFFSGAEGYTEERSVSSHIPAQSSWLELSFAVPAQPIGGILRFDPSNRPGLLEIAHVHFEIASSDRNPPARILLLAAEEGLRGLAVGGDCIQLPGRTVLTFVLFGDDPILFLPPLPEQAAGHAGRLVVNLRLLPEVGQSDWIEAVGHARQLHIISNSSKTAEGQHQSALLVDQLGATETEAKQAPSSVRELLTKHQSELDDSRRELAVLQANLAKREAELADAQAAISEATRLRTNAGTEITQAKEEILLLKASVAARDLDLRQTREMLADVLRMRAAIENEMSEVRRETNRLSIALSSNDSELAGAKSALAESLAIRQQLETALSATQRDLAEAETRNSTREAEAIKHQEILRTRVNEVSAEAGYLENSLNQLRGQYQLVLDSLHAQNAAIHDFKLRSGFVAKELQVLQHSADEAVADRQSLALELTATKELLAKIEGAAERERQKLIDRDLKVSLQREELAIFEERIARQAVKLAETEAMLAETYQSLSREQNLHREAQAVLKDKDTEATKLAERLTAIQRQVANEKTARATAESALAALNRRPLVRFDSALRGGKKPAPVQQA